MSNHCNIVSRETHHKPPTLDIFLNNVFVVTMFHVKHRLPPYETLVDYLLERNHRVNLTAIRSKDDAMIKHVEDSLILSDYINLAHSRARLAIEIGTGAGFPGLVVAKECPQLNITLLDSVEKKVRFVRDAIPLMALTNVIAVTDRAESFASTHLNSFDIVIARSVARLNVLLEYASPLLKIGGVLLAMKMADITEELAVAKAAAPILGFDFSSSLPYALLNQSRTIFCFKKTTASSISLPRHIGIAAHNPERGRF